MKFKRKIKYHYLKYKRSKDSPSRIAKGIALGISLDFFPTFGFGLIIAFLTAGLFRANRPAAVLAAIAGKWAIPFFYYLNYKIGQAITGFSSIAGENLTPQKFFHMINLKDLSYTFLLGSIINGIIVALITYYVVLKLSLFWEAKRAN